MRVRRISWIALSVFLGLIFAAAGVYGGTVFYDDFSDGNLDGWIVGGNTTARIVDGSLVISRNGFAEVRPEGIVLEDVSIRTQVRALTSSGAGLGVIVRSPIPFQNPCYYAAVFDTERDGDSFFGRCGGEADIFEWVDTDFDVIQEDVMHQLDAIGNQISFWAWRPDEPMPSKPLASVEDNRTASGGIQLWMNDDPAASVSGAYRFVRVADTHIPEPSTLLLCVIALAVVGGLRKWGG